MTIDAKAFTAFERTAHDRIAKTYAEHFAPLTSLALEPLLDAGRVSLPPRRMRAGSRQRAWTFLRA